MIHGVLSLQRVELHTRVLPEPLITALDRLPAGLSTTRDTKWRFTHQQNIACLPRASHKSVCVVCLNLTALFSFGLGGRVPPNCVICGSHSFEASAFGGFLALRPGSYLQWRHTIGSTLVTNEIRAHSAATTRYDRSSSNGVEHGAAELQPTLNEYTLLINFKILRGELTALFQTAHGGAANEGALAYVDRKGRYGVSGCSA
jgi:hypothetical protein